jgi:hypothetical protein
MTHTATSAVPTINSNSVSEAHQPAVVQAPKFSVGDVVTYTNDYGVKWCGKTITGIEVVNGTNRYFYTPHDAYWNSVPEASLKLEKAASK